jgi:aryl-alcohol dehydrogenase-like predicted oxidoreductase
MAKLGSTDLDVFPLCLSGNVFGWTADQETSFAVLDAYAEAGGNFVDTADSYMARIPGNSGGESETIIGRWLAARGNRERMVIATKGSRLPPNEGLSAEASAPPRTPRCAGWAWTPSTCTTRTSTTRSPRSRRP